MVKSKLPPQSGSSLKAVEPHPQKRAIKLLKVFTSPQVIFFIEAFDSFSIVVDGPYILLNNLKHELNVVMKFGHLMYCYKRKFSSKKSIKNVAWRLVTGPF